MRAIKATFLLGVAVAVKAIVLLMLSWWVPSAFAARSDGFVSRGGYDVYRQDRTGDGVKRSRNSRLFAMPIRRMISYATTSFCTDYASSITAGTNYFCWEGDGSGTVLKSSSSFDMTAQGSPSTVTRRVCPNGPDCGSMTSLRFNGTTQYLGSSNVPSPSGTFSVIWFGRADIYGGNVVVAKYGGGTNRSWFLQASVTPTFRVYKSDATGTSVIAAASTGVQSALQVYVATYRWVTDGTSVANIYVDGTLRGTSTTMEGPPQALSTPIGVMGGGAAVSLQNGHALMAAYIEGVELSQAQVTAITDKLIPPLKGTRGEAITTTAGTVPRTCTAANGDISILPAGRPCVTCPIGATTTAACGLWTEPSVQRLDTFPTDFTNAAWVKVNATISPSSTTAPDGSTSADKLVETIAVGAHHMAQNVVPVPADNATTTCSIYGKSGERSWIALEMGTKVPTNLSRYFDLSTCTVGTGTGVTTTYTENLGNGWCRAVMAGSVGAGAGTVFCRVYLASSDGVVSYAGDGSSGAHLWHFQPEVNGTTYATTPIAPYDTTAATRSGVAHTFAKPSALSLTEGCTRITVTPIWTGGNPLAVSSRFLDGNSLSTARLFYNTGLTDTGISSYDGANVTGAVVPWVANTAATARTYWSATRNKFHMTQPSPATLRTFTSFPSFDANITIGALSGSTSTQPIGALIGNVVLGRNDPDGCNSGSAL